MEEKPIEETDVAVLIDRFSYGRCVDMSVFERNREAAESECKRIIFCKNTDKLAIFTNTGQMHLVKVLDLPQGKFRDKGQPLDNVSNFDSGSEREVYIEALGNLKEKKLIFGTKTGMLKVVAGSEFIVGKRTTAATKLAEGDELLTVAPLEEEETLVMQTAGNVFLRIDAATIPEKKKGAVGVRGIRLETGDLLEEIHVLHPGDNPTLPSRERPSI